MTERILQAYLRTLLPAEERTLSRAELHHGYVSFTRRELVSWQRSRSRLPFDRWLEIRFPPRVPRERKT